MNWSLHSPALFLGSEKGFLKIEVNSGPPLGPILKKMCFATTGTRPCALLSFLLPPAIHKLYPCQLLSHHPGLLPEGSGGFFVSLPKHSIHKRLSPIPNKTYSALRGHERAAGQFILIYWKHYRIAQRPWSESSCAQSCSSLSAALQSRKMDEVARDKMRSSPPRTTLLTVGI